MHFPAAFTLMRGSNKKMIRQEWRPNKFIHERTPDDGLPYLEIVMKDGRKAPYVPSTCDLYGQDWVEVP